MRMRTLAHIPAQANIRAHMLIKQHTRIRTKGSPLCPGQLGGWVGRGGDSQIVLPPTPNLGVAYHWGMTLHRAYGMASGGPLRGDGIAW